MNLIPDRKYPWAYAGQWDLKGSGSEVCLRGRLVRPLLFSKLGQRVGSGSPTMKLVRSLRKPSELCSSCLSLGVGRPLRTPSAHCLSSVLPAMRYVPSTLLSPGIVDTSPISASGWLCRLSRCSWIIWSAAIASTRQNLWDLTGRSLWAIRTLPGCCRGLKPTQGRRSPFFRMNMTINDQGLSDF